MRNCVELKHSIDNLPIEILRIIAMDLDSKSLLKSSQVCQKWFGLFSDKELWKNKIIREFGIKPDSFKNLPLPNNSKEHNKFFKYLYYRLHTINNHARQLPFHTQLAYKDSSLQPLLLFACSDNPDFKINHVGIEELDILIHFAIFAGSKNIFKTVMEHLKNKLKCKTDEYLTKNHIAECLTIALKSGNLQFIKELIGIADLQLFPLNLNDATASGKVEVLKYLLDHENNFGNLSVDECVLNSAAKYGQLDVVKYLLNDKNNFGLEIKQRTIINAAHSGNFELFQHLESRIQPKEHMIEEILYETILSCNHKLVRHFLDNYITKQEYHNYPLNLIAQLGSLGLFKYVKQRKDFHFCIDETILINALKSGDLELITYLLAPENKFDLILHPEMILCVIASKNLQTTLCLLTSFKIKPTKLMLDLAAEIGFFEFVEYLLKNDFGLSPDDFTFTIACKSGHYSLVRYLLDPRNNFGLVFTEWMSAKEISHNRGLDAHLIPSNITMHKGLKELRQLKHAEANTFFDRSYKYCPKHFIEMANDALTFPKKYELENSSIEFLQSVLNKKIAINSQAEEENSISLQL